MLSSSPDRTRLESNGTAMPGPRHRLQERFHRRRSVVEEIHDQEELPTNTSQPIIEEPDDTGGYCPPEPAQASPQTVDRSIDRLFSQDTGFFGEPSLFFGSPLGMPSLSHFLSLPSTPVSGGGSYRYQCMQWSSVGGFGGPRIEHMVSAHGSSNDGHFLRETVTDGRTGQRRIREESRPAHRSHYGRSITID